MRFLSFLSLLLCFPLTLGLNAAGATRVEAASAGTKNTAPAFALPAVSGTVSSDSLRGHVVLVDFWASWCAPCAQSFPWLASVQQRFADQGLQVVAINLDKDRDAAKRFLVKHPANFTVAFDPAAETAQAFRVGNMPTSYLLGPDGTILFSKAGFDPKHTGEMEAHIQEACRP
jgi:cytochrome c biogenesis protein CcmG/thiol:disulfide interchange protein DsbE